MPPIRNTYSMVPYNPYGRIQTTSQAMIPYIPARRTGYARGSITKYTTQRTTRRYRSKWSTFNSRTNPVYPRPEVKNIDYQRLATPISNLGSVTVLNRLSQGPAQNQRIGRSVATKSVYYQYVLNFGTGPAPNCIRHMLVWDRQPNGDTASVDQILEGGSVTVTAPLELNNKDRFVVLADERLTLSPQGDQIRFSSGFRSINQKTTYDNDILDDIPATGALLLLLASDEAIEDNMPNMYGTWRIRYIDN